MNRNRFYEYVSFGIWGIGLLIPLIPEIIARIFDVANCCHYFGYISEPSYLIVKIQRILYVVLVCVYTSTPFALVSHIFWRNRSAKSHLGGIVLSFLGMFLLGIYIHSPREYGGMNFGVAFFPIYGVLLGLLFYLLGMGIVTVFGYKGNGGRS